MKLVDWILMAAITIAAVGYIQYQNQKDLEAAYIGGLVYTAAIEAARAAVEE